MSPYKLYERDVSATAALHPSIGHHWVKRLARRIGVAMPTARDYIYRGVPDCRLPVIAAAILAECDELERLIAQTRERWGERDHEAAGAQAGRNVGQARAPSRRLGRRGEEAMTPPS